MKDYFSRITDRILRNAVDRGVDFTKEELALIDDWYNIEREGIEKGCAIWYDKAFFVNHIKYFNGKVSLINSALKHRGHKPYPTIKFKVQLYEGKG